MFRTVSLKYRSSFRSLKHKSPEFLRLHVKRMDITIRSLPLEDASYAFSKCTGIIDLCLWTSWMQGGSIQSQKEALISALSQLPRRHLALPYELLEEIRYEGSPTPAWCTTLTHLELHSHYWRPSYGTQHIGVVSGLQHLHALTHLCVAWPVSVPEPRARVYLASILELRPSLRVLLVPTSKILPDDYTPSDIRIVYQMGDSDHENPDSFWEWTRRNPGVSHWTWAGEVVEGRRRSLEKGGEARPGRSSESTVLHRSSPNIADDGLWNASVVSIPEPGTRRH